MNATPFTISSELGRDDRTDPRSWLRARWQRLVSRRRGAAETRSVLAEIDGIDFAGRFATVAGVRATLQRYSIRHGGAWAARALERLRTRLADVDSPAAYRHLLRLSGRRPEDIATWVRSTTLHVNKDNMVMRDGDAERPFTPLETAITGVGQCTGFAALAAALIETAGYPTRLWGVPGHTFLEWRRPNGRWQLEDVDVLPPDAPLPRGMSMRALLENYPEWARILDTLPCLNLVVRAHCFVPTDGGELICWRHPIAEPTRYRYLKNFSCGSMPREMRWMAIAGIDAANCAVLVDNDNPSPRVLVICDAPFDAERARFDDKGIQHDIYAFARASTLYDRQFSGDARRLYALVPGGAKRFPVPVGPLAGGEVSAFAMPADNAAAHPFLIAPRIALPATADAEAPPADPHLDDDDTAIGAARAAAILDKLRLPPFRGRVLDAGCGTGAFALALARNAESVAAIDTRDDCLGYLSATLDRLSPRPPVAPTPGSVEELPFGDGDFDAVFCRDAARHADLGRVLAEFRRVTRRGGQVYMRCRADGWYRYMMLGCGGADPDAARRGRDSLYATVWRRCAAVSLAPLRESVGRRGPRLADPAGVDMETLLDEMERHLRDMNSENAATIRRLELRVRDACGDGHLRTVLADILANAAGRQQGPTVPSADHAWQPEEVAALAAAAGFTGFTWWSAAGSRETPGLRPLEIGPMLETPETAGRHFRSALTVWHCLFTKA